jgi:serine/threonine protein kinase
MPLQTTIVDGRYELLSLLGRASMGDVYLAHDELLGREVALKVPKERHAESGEFVERFWREAKNVAPPSHPNVVTVFDGGG